MKADVNQRFEYQLSKSPDIEVTYVGDQVYRLWKGGEVFEIELMDYHIRSKSFVIAIDGYVFEVGLKDELDERIQQIRQQTDSSINDRVVLAPIPGLIKQLLKQDGTSVDKGDPVLILEAMKMENTIQASSDSSLVTYHVDAGEHVVKGQKLFTLE